MPSDATAVSGAQAGLLLLNQHDVAALLQPADVMQAVREAFVLHSAREGRVFPVVREKLATGGIFGIKSGDVASQGLLGFKAAGFWPANRGRGAEPHQATLMLFDPATGRPTCLIDGNTITTERTAAAGALGLQTLARAESTRLCVFGTGVQAQAHVDHALRVMPGLREVTYLSSRRLRDEAFEARFASRCKLHCGSDADAAVAKADVVITATPGPGPLFSADAVQPGTHLNCVGADTRGKRELPGGLLPRVRLVVDDAPQAREIGETQWAPDTPCTELGDLLARTTALPRTAADITVFDMTGLALQDLCVARLVQARAQAAGLGTRVAWPW